MSKETVLKATFKDLIAKKIQKEQNKEVFKDIFVTSMGKSLTFKKPSEEVIINLLDDISDKSSMAEQMEYMRKLIYLSCPMLQDTELHSELGVADPFEVVPAIFDMKDVNEIGQELIELIGLNDVEEKIKN